MNSSPIWTAAGWTMLHIAWIGGVIGAGGWILRFVLRNAQPETRYAAALICLALLAIAPISIFFRVYEPLRDSPIAVQETAVDTRAMTSAEQIPLFSKEPRKVAPASDFPRVENSNTSLTLDSLVIYLPWLWLGGSSITIALLASGLVGVHRLRKSSRGSIDESILRRAQQIAQSLGVSQRFRVGMCDRLNTPVLVGIFRPMILLPPALLCGWTVDELEMALLHEIAHLKRCDNLVNFLQCIVESLLFFHPATWWLSSWVRLEREHCCDRLVVEKTGKSRLYAEMLASFVGVTVQRPALSSLAERPLISRIRRILNMEERPMRLSFKEGLGLILAGLAASAIAITVHPRTSHAHDKKEADNAKLSALKMIAEKTMEVPVKADPGGDRASTLMEIAQEQFRLGDREDAKATMRRAETILNEVSIKNKTSVIFEVVIKKIQVAETWREFDDLSAARATLDRLTNALQAPTDPKAKEALEKSAREAGAGEDAADLPGVMIGEAARRIADERIVLGDLDEARRLILWAVQQTKSITGESKPLYDAVLGATLARAGDTKAGRALVLQAERENAAQPEASRGRNRRYIAGKLAECGEFDAAFAILKDQEPRRSEATAVEMLDAFQEYDPVELSGWVDPAGIKILIGQRGTKAKNLDGLREFAKRLRVIDDTKVKGRTLSAAATLLAKAGDFPAAIEAADAIPAMKRADLPGPSDGFYDSVKPATLAMVAAWMAKKGDKAGAADVFDRSAALARGIENGGEKLIALIVLADSYAEAKDNLAAMSVIGEAVELAKSQDEPRRSRGLVMLARIQNSKLGDPSGAVKVIDAIRAYPGAEKAETLVELAYAFEKAGDEANAKAMAKLVLDGTTPKKPDGFKIGALLNLNAFGRDTYIDPDLEFGEPMAKFDLARIAERARNIIGDVAEAEKVARALPVAKGAVGGRSVALGSLAIDLVLKGKLDEALRIAGSIEDPNDKLWAYQQMARAIRNRK